jgi:predicted ester cyclase/ketosteroid isomerase-like protein
MPWMGSIEENKRVARRVLTEIVGGGRLDLIDELVADDFVTEPPDGQPGPDGYRDWVARLRGAFPDLTIEIEDQIGEVDGVATRFTGRATHTVEHLGIPPTGRQIATSGIVIHEVRGGKLTNFWLSQDDLATLRQLTDAGTAPSSRPAAGRSASSQGVLEELRRRTVEAYGAADAEAAADLYAESAVQQPPGRPPVIGREAIRDSYRLLFSQGGLSLALTPWETVELGSGSEARERGGYRLTLGEQVLLAGKYLFVAARTHGGWRYVWTTVTPD